MSSTSSFQLSEKGYTAPNAMSLSSFISDAHAFIFAVWEGLVAMESTTLLSMPCASI